MPTYTSWVIANFKKGKREFSLRINDRKDKKQPPKFELDIYYWDEDGSATTVGIKLDKIELEMIITAIQKHILISDEEWEMKRVIWNGKRDLDFKAKRIQDRISEYKKKQKALKRQGYTIMLRDETELRKRRDTIICKMHKDGKPYNDIAHEFGLSRERVYQICKKKEKSDEKRK